MSEIQKAPPAKYKVLERLRSEAGVVEVFKAMQSGLDRPVEIRLLDAEKLGDKSEMLRFEREFRTLATLDHPLVYKVLDWGLLGEKVFYVTEWRDMRSLEQLLSGSTVFDPKQLFSIAGQLGDALLYLHSKGVIHRSLGLRSVLFDVERDRCAIAEFPMVKDSRLADLTARGVSQLLPELATPEFLQRKPASAPTDVFLLGALLYRLWMGREPFTQEEYLKLPKVDSASFTELIAPLSPMNASGEEMPEALGRLIARCLAFEAEARPPGARSFLDDLADAAAAARADAQRRKRLSRRAASASARVAPESLPAPRTLERAYFRPAQLALILAGVGVLVALAWLLLR
ncbi:MAG: protein kinase [Candidatus Wallbacteria bacterium]|nr:protein kinase [Candidatus Wallbacteria bacterium]